MHTIEALAAAAVILIPALVISLIICEYDRHQERKLADSTYEAMRQQINDLRTAAQLTVLDQPEHVAPLNFMPAEWVIENVYGGCEDCYNGQHSALEEDRCACCSAPFTDLEVHQNRAMSIANNR